MHSIHLWCIDTEMIGESKKKYRNNAVLKEATTKAGLKISDFKTKYINVSGIMSMVGTKKS